jgi:hypothetical protein
MIEVGIAELLHMFCHTLSMTTNTSYNHRYHSVVVLEVVVIVVAGALIVMVDLVAIGVPSSPLPLAASHPCEHRCNHTFAQ